MLNIYVASSWRNDHQPTVVARLREAGHGVYDFRNPASGVHGFRWSEIDPYWQQWTPEVYRTMLTHPKVESGFDMDIKHLLACDVVVAVQPFGRSTALELGWACGIGTRTVLLLSSGEPELMVKMCDHICITLDEVIVVLNGLR